LYKGKVLKPDHELRALLSKAMALKARWPVYGEMIDWLVELLAETIGAQYRVNLPEVHFNRAQLDKLFATGKPLFVPLNIPIDMHLAVDTWQKLIAKTEGFLGRKVLGLKQLSADPDWDMSELIKQVLKSETARFISACRVYNIDPQSVKLLLRLSVRPSLRKTSQIMSKKMDLMMWSFGYCPVCGSAPLLAQFGNEGESRRLYCSFCETLWTYPRMRCPFCASENQDGLSYWYAESEEGIRLDLCSHCQQRLKTIDARYPAGMVVPVLDDLVTSHLEMAIHTYNK